MGLRGVPNVSYLKPKSLVISKVDVRARRRRGVSRASDLKPGQKRCKVWNFLKEKNIFTNKEGSDTYKIRESLREV